MRASRQRPWGRSRPTISAREAIVKVGWVLRREVIDDGRFAAAGRTDTVPGARHPTAAGPTSVGRPDRTPGLGRPAARLPPGVGDRAVRPLAAGATAPAPSWPSVHVACPADRRARPRLTRPERQPSPHVAAACRPPDAGRRRPRYRKGGGTAPPANLDEVDGEARLCVSASSPPPGSSESHVPGRGVGYPDPGRGARAPSRPSSARSGSVKLFLRHTTRSHMTSFAATVRRRSSPTPFRSPRGSTGRNREPRVAHLRRTGPSEKLARPLPRAQESDDDHGSGRQGERSPHGGPREGRKTRGPGGARIVKRQAAGRVVLVSTGRIDGKC